ncbi:MAG: hypothetical protein WCL04_01935, partial [Verrucomicrobiota bacterium]
MKHICSIFLLVACLVSTSRAQTVVASSLNDLILGFRATDGTQGAGTDKNLEIDLGNVGQFYNLPTNTTMAVANLRTDLETIYDLVWNARTDLTWGIIGTTGNATGTTINGTTIAATTIWAGKGETTAGV